MGRILGFAFQVLLIASFAIVTFQISPDKQNDDETLPEEIEKGL